MSFRVRTSDSPTFHMTKEEYVWKQLIHERSSEHLCFTLDTNNRLSVSKIKKYNKLDANLLCVIKCKGFLEPKLKHMNGYPITERVVNFLNLTKDYHLV